MTKSVEEILEENWGDTRCMVMGIEEYIEQNYTPNTSIQQSNEEYLDRFVEYLLDTIVRYDTDEELFDGVKKFKQQENKERV